MTDEEKLIIIANYKEHYGSLKANIQTANEELTGVYKLMADAQESLNKINRDILSARNELAELLARQEFVRESIKKEEAILAERQRLFEEAEAKHFAEIKSYVKRVEDEGIKLLSVTKELEETRAALSDILDKAQVIPGLIEYINGLEAVATETRESVDSWKKAIEEAKVLYDKNRTQFLNELAALEEEIYIKQRSLDGFKANKEKLETDLARREKDVMTIIARLQKLSMEKFGLPLKI